MLNWLAVWLQQIIAVVLLAGFIDLLLPNKAMQRYVRLVAGLIILLTILTPIIRLLQGDFNARLDQQVDNWFQSTNNNQFHMPTLEDIQEDAKKLQDQQKASALALVEQRLGSSMKESISEATGLQVAAVGVKLTAANTIDQARIESVVVTLAKLVPETESESESEDDSKATGDSKSANEVKPVDEVEAIEVTVQPMTDQSAGSPGSTNASDSQEEQPASSEVAAAVREVLRQEWSVNPKRIEVMQQQADAESAQ
ncbi:stage III sporulation protein AF [Paenibacillus sp. OV219]|uniref:stage III sporulation protein AF n=1 Tax=Paenibacillus sp. OV219 TaxID=1884377 RepID=UPI0008AD9661|nr:stage III sporulation protein AF [Paenibacillus sp. OV219]SEN17965.1 stage III sporulation protein AF [Paenibacillus sp. OV219]